MRTGLLSCLLFVSSINVLSAHEIAIIGGEPDRALGFIREMIIDRTDLSDKEQDLFSTTMVYSTLYRSGIRDTALIALLDGDATTRSLLDQGLALASSKAPVVQMSLGPVDDDFCKVLAQYTHTAFVVYAGNGSMQLDDVLSPSCSAGNILVVAALDQTRGELLSFSNWGPQVRIASPSSEIEVILPGGKLSKQSSAEIGLSLVSAQLALLAKTQASLQGSNLIDSFLKKDASFLPKLNGKIKDGLALLR